MKAIDWRGVAELVGIAAIIASLIFVGFQLRQEQRIAVSQIGQADAESSAQIDLAIAEHAEVWLKSNKGQNLTEIEQVVMNRLVSTLYRRARIEAVMRRSLGQSGHSPIIDFAVDLYENPGARAIWERQAESEKMRFQLLAPEDDFRQSYQSEVLSKLEELDRAGTD